MPPSTSSGISCRTSCEIPAGRQPAPEACLNDPDDRLLAAVLIRMWALASGRSLRTDVPPCQLSSEELIAFWADDMNMPTGRHARHGGSDNIGSGQAPDKAARSARRSRGRRHRHSHARVPVRRQESPWEPAIA
jgi:hypothetical protein